MRFTLFDIRFADWDRIGKKYGVTMAVHHHTFSSRNQYFDPEVMLKFVKDYKNVRSNPDTGHWSRCGIDPVKGLKILRGTIRSVHFKDQQEFGNHTSLSAVLGKGKLDLKSILKELDSQGYDGFFVIEYEDDWDNNLPQIKECVQYLRTH